MSQILSFQYPSDMESVTFDVIRCASFEFAKRSGETGVCLLLVTLIQNPDPIQVVANLNSGEASIVLPLPVWEKELPFGTAFLFSGRVYIISDRDNAEAMQEAISAFAEHSVLYWFSLDRDTASMKGYQFNNGDGKWVPASRSAEAAAAAAMILHSDLKNGTMESTIDQPGGILEIGLRKENGQVLGLSAGGPVEVRE